MTRRIIIFLGITFFCNTFFIQNINAVSLDLKIPFVSGEEWKITQGYDGDGWGSGKPTHNSSSKDRFALDFSLSGESDYNKQVLAVADGVVSIKESKVVNKITGAIEYTGYGKYVDIDHGDGIISRYAHFVNFAVRDGEKVKQGQLIGYLDSTGYSSGSHLHFAMYQKDANGNLTPYKPEPMSGYTDFKAGEWYTSDNEFYDPNKKVEESTLQPQPKTLWQRVKEILGIFNINNTSSKSTENVSSEELKQDNKVEVQTKTAEEEIYSLSFLNSGGTIKAFPGEEINLVVEAKNTGNVVWSQKNISTNVVGGLKANAVYYNKNWLTSLRPTLLDQSQILPGEIGSFSFKINTPFSTGKYNFKIQLVRVDNNFNVVNGGYWTVNLDIQEKEEFKDEEVQEAVQKLTEKIENLSEQLKVEESDENTEDIIKSILLFESNGTQNNYEEETTFIEEKVYPEIKLNYPTTTIFYTTSTNIIFSGEYNTSTVQILVNNIIEDLLMNDGVWQYETDLTIGTSTFSFVGWDSGFSTSSEEISITVVREEISTVVLSAPIILQPNTSTIYTSSTNFLVTGEKTEDLKNIYLQQGDLLVTSTVLTTTIWEQNVCLQEGENILIFYGTDEFGNRSATTSVSIILDTQVPEVEWVNIDLGTNWAQLNYNVTDTISVVGYDLQFLFQYYSWPPSDFDPTIEEGEIILPVDDPILWRNQNDLANYLDIAENERTWFATSTVSTSTFIQLADFIYDLPVHFRVRAIDRIGNVGEWKYSGLNFFDSIYQETGKIVISEIAWMGTEASADDEWIEVRNVDENPIDMSNWKLAWDFNTSTGEYDTVIDLDDLVLDQGDSWLLERTNQETVSTFDVSQIYTGALSNQGEHMVLLDANGDIMDEVNNSNGWWFGDNETKESMYRSSWENSGNEISSWTNFTSSTSYINIWYKEEKDSAGNYILGSPGNAPTSMM